MQFHSSPYILAILEALQSEVDELHSVYSDLKTKRWINTSEGYNLDVCGEIANQSRVIQKAIAIPYFGFEGQYGTTGFGQARLRLDREKYLDSSVLADAEYRKIIWARIAKNTTKGKPEDMINSLYNIFNAKIILTELGGAKIAISVGRILTEQEILLANAVDLFIKPAGVGFAWIAEYEQGNTFGFANTSQGYTGFGQGRMAREI